MQPEVGRALVAAAEALGSRPLAWYLAGLALACGAAALGALLLRHGARARLARGEGAAVSRRLVLAMGLGFAIVAGAGIQVFSAIGARIVPGHPVVQADHALADAIGIHLAPAALPVFAWLTHAGDPAWLVALCAIVAVLLWRQRRRTLALAWLLTLGGQALLNPALKQAFERARPAYEGLLVTAPGFSFPSGHSAGAMTAYGMLAYVALRTLPARWHVAVLVAAAALVYTTACSRVLLRVHFASDVVAGLLSSGTWLLVCIASAQAARHYRRARRRRAAPAADD